MDASDSTGLERGRLDEDDHDLLTFTEARARLDIEINKARTELEHVRTSGGSDAIKRSSARLDALLAAASRNRASTINDANFEKFFGYRGPAKRNITDGASEE